MKVKKYKDFQKDQQQVLFSAKSLQKEKDEKPSFKTSVEDQEKTEKEFKKELDKIEKYESFITINIDHVDNIDCESDYDFSDSEDYEEVTGCGCCDECSGEEGCYCGCDDCNCNSDEDGDCEQSEITGCGCCDECTGEEDCYCGCEDCKCDQQVVQLIPASDFISNLFSESLKYHLENNKPITENIFRPGSETFFNVIKEARKFFDSGKIQLCDIDKEIFESTDMGRFGWFNGELVALDLPMENIIELNEAEYQGKKVKLGYPMRNTGSGKKYYVYVKNPKTKKVIRVNFGDVKGGLTAKVSDPEARKNFAARHKCSTKKDKTKAGYWACRINKYGHLWGGKTYPGFW